ncbi:uncharacterized protein [Amphiura filiformis]|uniref:uncharacterized protein n=1 Tax=Amphiura filiformis TaxID=82378 RepID=UPI003B220493
MEKEKNEVTMHHLRSLPSFQNSKSGTKNLPISRQTEILAKKRKRSKEQYQNPEKAKQKRAQSKESYKDPEKAEQKREQARKQSKKSYKDPEKAERKREQSKESYKDPEKAEQKREQAREQSKKSYKDPEKAERKREQSKELYKHPETAERKREQSKESYENPEYAKKKRQQSQFNRYQKKSDIDIVITNFQKACKDEHRLIYICQVCQRIFFKRQVVALYTSRYNESILLESLHSNVEIQSLPINKGQDQSHGEKWICNTCHSDLLANRVPRLATVNKLALVEQPHVLSELNMLERHLISPAILFMKMISLIKGAQKGISGQVVCVKFNVNNTAACLPRLPTEQSLIRIKLKRRLIYKGHHMCQDVNPENVRQALKWLKANNPVFEDIDINFDQFDSVLDDQLISSEHDQENDIIAEPHSPNESELATESIASDSTELYEYIDIDEEQDMHDQDEDSSDNIEIRWIDIDNGILISQGKQPMTAEQHKNMTWEDHCKIIMSNPAAAARMFQQRVHTLINDVILSPANHIGKVEDYYYRTEFQQRGWPHIHMIAWVKDAPEFDTDPDEEIAEFIDKYVSCELPPEEDVELHEIVSKVQMHTKSHTRSCRKTGLVCRFNYPRPPSNETFICRRPESIDDLDLNELEAEVERTDRKEREENAKETIKKICWNGNMDIQYILDPFAGTIYMLSYLTKCEREMGDLLRNAQREAREGNADVLTELRKVGNVYLQHREISVMGAIYMVCSMPLKQSSRNVVFVQTDVDGHRISLPLQQLQENAGNSEEVWQTSQIEKYIGRPKVAKYENMCMAKFFSSHYQVSSKESTQAENETDDQTEDDQSDYEDGSVPKEGIKRCRPKQKAIALSGCSAKMKQRTTGKPAVIRYPRVSIHRDKERYHMNMLRLYLPHRRKQIKPESYETYESYHLQGRVTINGEIVSVQEIVQHNMKEFEPDNGALDNAWDALQEIPDLQDAWNALNPQGEQQQQDDRLERNLYEDSDDELAEIEIPELQQPQQQRQDLPRCAIETCRPEITEEQAESMMRQLNNKQRQLFNYVTKWCNDKASDHTISPFHFFLTGGAGTGKSHLIKCITYARKTFLPMTENVEEVTVLLLAHMGTAAFNIYGQTICTGLKIPPKGSHHYTPLAEESVNTLRMKYRHLQLVIIDEISMVSVPQFDYIHGRLQQIKGSSDTTYFGNVSILAVGDFYQLPPISPRTPLCLPRDDILMDLWNLLFNVVELTEIMRQKDDVVFAQMLNRLRTRKRNEQISDIDMKLLQSRTVSDSHDNGLSAPNDAMHLFYRNNDVDEHNEKMLATLSTHIHTIQAIDIDQTGGRIIRINEQPHTTKRKDRNTTLADELKLAVGARVMLISNVDVTDGLCNGVSGVFKGIEFCNSTNMPTVVYVKFDSSRIGAKARITEFIPPHYQECTPIKPRKESFQLKGKTFTTTREQIPLKLSWAVTIHKIQGQTTDQAVISMKYLQTAMAYVALSRVTHLDGMYLMNFDARRIYCDETIAPNIAKMSQCNLSVANPLLEIDHNNYFIIAHHNIQSLNRHFEDMKNNSEFRKAHVICLSETWLTSSNNPETIAIDGYSLESINSGSGIGYAIYVQNSVKYNVLPLITEHSDVLAIRTSGRSNLLIAAIYKPVATSSRVFNDEMNEITAQIENLETDFKVLVGDFNRNLMKEQVLPAFRQYNQVIEDPTTTKGTLLDHIYIKPTPQNYSASVLTSYYSYHHPTFVAIKF